jgi:hypothetical protein
MNLKPVYSIQELADILKIKVHEIANGLAASSVPAFYSGKEITLSKYDCFLPGNRSPSCIYVMTDRQGNVIQQHSPSPSTVTVSTASLPQVWIDSIEKAEPQSDTASNDSQNASKSLGTTERNTLLTIIAALCDYSDIKHDERGAAAQIARLTQDIGAAVDDGTVKRHLEKIPDALESRTK